MKKIFTLVLVLLLAFSVLVGCSKPESDPYTPLEPINGGSGDQGDGTDEGDQDPDPDPAPALSGQSFTYGTMTFTLTDSFYASDEADMFQASEAAMFMVQVSERIPMFTTVMTQEFVESILAATMAAESDDYTISVEEFESLSIGGNNAIRMVCAFGMSGITMDMNVYFIDADQTYMFIYMDLFKSGTWDADFDAIVKGATFS